MHRILRITAFLLGLLSMLFDWLGDCCFAGEDRLRAAAARVRTASIYSTPRPNTRRF